MTLISILAVSILLQIAAAVVALRLMQSTGKYLAWSLIAAALVMMAARRSVTFVNIVEQVWNSGVAPASTYNLTAEIIALAISATMLAGVTLIGPIFAARQKAEAAERESSAKYRTIVDNSIDTFYRTDAEGNIVFASRSATDLLGYSIDELMGRKLAELYADPSGREEFLKALSANGGHVRGYETPLRRKSGEVVLVATSAGFVRDNAGNVVGVEGIARDISEQKRAEALSTRLGHIVEDSANEIYVFDSQSLRFLMVNRGARENLGYTMAELFDLTPIDIEPEFDTQSFAELVAPLRDRTQEIVDFETVHQRKDGSTYDVEVSLQLARTEEPAVLFAVVQDVTERRRTENALHQAQKMEAVGQLTGGIAHDFNNLLAIIIGNLELAGEFIEEGSEVAGRIQRASDAAARSADLTQRLLAFSRRQTLSPLTVNLNDIIGGMSELLHSTMGEPIDIEVVGMEGLWNCEVDPNQMESTLLNLAINARDAMPTGGRLCLETSNVVLDSDMAEAAELRPGEYIALKVNDTGIGMPPDTVEHVFEPFFTTKSERKGTGLGLSMVHGFVKQSSGHVRVESVEGRGTTFEIFLPRSKNPSIACGSGKPQSQRSGAGKTVVVVEDEKDVRDLVVTMLGELGYRTLDAGTGEEALELFRREEAVHALVTDVVLPGGLSGPDIAKACLHENAGLKVLLVSGYPQNKIDRDGRFDPDTEFLQKPFSKHALSQKLDKLAI